MELHRRLVDGDPVAPSDLAVAYLDSLVAWLSEQNPRLDHAIHSEAASEAICSLIKQPQSFDPSRASLAAYLRMSAQADLKNVLRREGRHHRRRESLETVALSPDAGKYLGRECDPSFSMQIEEERRKAQPVEIEVAKGLTEAELSALELVRSGERKTAAFAMALGITHLPVAEQKAQVKRVKDRLKKRLERTRRHDN